MDITDKYYEIIGDYLEKQVIRIENKIPTTKDRYGDYLHLISTLIGEKIPKKIKAYRIRRCYCYGSSL